MSDKVLNVDSQVYGFVMLLYSQQLFTQMFNAEKDSEFDRIKPVIRRIRHALSSEVRKQSHEAALHYNGFDNLGFKGMNDLWFCIYCISNYRVPYVKMLRDDLPQEEEILYNVIYNVNVKAHKIHRMYNQRFV